MTMSDNSLVAWHCHGAQGEILIPGDKLLDGTVLIKSEKCAGRTDSVYYTSQTIKYAGPKLGAGKRP